MMITQVPPEELRAIISSILESRQWTLRQLANELEGPWEKKFRDRKRDGQRVERKVHSTGLSRIIRKGKLHTKTYNQLKVLAGENSALVSDLKHFTNDQLLAELSRRLLVK